MHDTDVNLQMFQEDVDLPASFWEGLPVPAYWRIIVMPVKPKEVSKGGIVLAVSNQEAQAILNFVGKVVALGPLAGKHERLGGTGTEPGPAFPKVGDYVAFGRYCGQAMKFKTAKLLIINDDEILAVVPNPETLQTSR